MTKVAVVTGAGTGIGRQVARALLDDGYGVALAGRRRDPLLEAAGESAGALVVPTDVTDAESVAALFDAVRERWGRLDVLFNNAGTTGTRGSVDTLPVEDWKAIVDVNLTGMFLCAQQAVRMMKEQDPRGGRIVNNGSISAHTPRPETVAYAATKHALTGLTKSIALDGRPHDIACGQIDIGNAATELTSGFSDVGMPQADGSLKSEPTFDAAHVADAVLTMVNLPLSANVPFLTIMANGMPFIGRG
ncbi:NAD(P)-dependent dehydrogenase (short-subunit alcohol dehydrogenase family) [Prauserella isguenensis]|uniref:NAD(P)-dependent dehydrogenase (Short-subunit alcohol dehydrogenase family) n=1 Tax=Prauserella isguenensis TaxID=1470180 RepID=A0A839S3B3_9PSEU|nr:SDR family oxidoreductase [Prauserella isguenensis]MBB3051249.1 NAD(P)-dependent dehydrogenase (short-subunit alcohol dehydrogenase family) [Prauserella isguenensis]